MAGRMIQSSSVQAISHQPSATSYDAYCGERLCRFGRRSHRYLHIGARSTCASARTCCLVHQVVLWWQPAKYKRRRLRTRRQQIAEVPLLRGGIDRLALIVGRLVGCGLHRVRLVQRLLDVVAQGGGLRVGLLIGGRGLRPLTGAKRQRQTNRKHPMHLHRRDLTWGGVILERVMYFGVSAFRRVGRQRHGAGAARLALAPAKPALRTADGQRISSQRA
ncbi:hypothetical protein XAC2852_810048 [Xanthomonas citri pv. citri]|nr:hypothetical protein XAC2852_810048 [Xanthomonas citri pv. citri]